MRKMLFMPFAAALALVNGCDKSSPPTSGPLATDPGEPKQAQPRLQTLKLWLGSEEMVAELALSYDQVRTGMMFRTQMPENEGMLFAFAAPHRASFWMKNTKVPL